MTLAGTWLCREQPYMLGQLSVPFFLPSLTSCIIWAKKIKVLLTKTNHRNRGNTEKEIKAKVAQGKNLSKWARFTSGNSSRSPTHPKRSDFSALLIDMMILLWKILREALPLTFDSYLEKSQ